jgi:hypothetical protein
MCYTKYNTIFKVTSEAGAFTLNISKTARIIYTRIGTNAHALLARVCLFRHTVTILCHGMGLYTYHTPMYSFRHAVFKYDTV